MRWTRTVALALSSAVALTACTAGTAPKDQAKSSGEAVHPAQSVSPTSLLDPSAKGPAAPVPGAREGGTVRVVSEAAPSTLDPTQQYYVDSAAILRLTNRTLTTFAVRDGRSVLVPDLATDLGRVSADGLTWTFTLKEGITYEDGTPVTAADVVYAVKRSFAQKELPGGPTYQVQHLRDGEDYEGPFTDGTDFAGVEAKGDKDVVVHLDQPWTSMPYFASFTLFSPIPRAKDTRSRYGERPLATGPYKFAEHTPGKALTLVRNPQWKADTDPARHAYLDRLVFEWAADPAQTQRAILSGADGTADRLTYDPILPELAPLARQNAGRMVQGVSPCMQFVSMDTRQIPLDVRRAIAVAYPWDAIGKAAGINDMTIQPRRSYAPPQLAGATEQDVPGVPVSGPGDPAKARQMLAAAGKEGFELSWYVAQDNPISRAQSEARAAGLRQAGFRVRTFNVPGERLQDVSIDLDAPVNMLQGPRGWCYDWPNGDAVYPPLFSSTARSESMNAGGLADPDLDERMAAITSKPLAEQGPLWAALDKELVAEHLPALPAGNDKATYMFGDRVGGVVNDPNLGLPDFSALYVKG